MEFIVFDCETWRSNSFAFGVVYYPDRQLYLTFFDAESLKKHFMKLVRRDRKTKYKFTILAHNCSYDLNWIFGNYETFFAPTYKEEGKQKRKRFHIDCLARSGRFYYAKYYNLYFIDTFNIFPTSLEKAGKVVGYPKLKMSQKFMQKIPKEITEKDIEYCKTDCLVCWKIFNKIGDWVESKGGLLKHTISSSGLTILKHKNPNFKKYLDELNKNWKIRELDELFRLAFFGGRTEVIKKMIIDGYYFDVNSEYPYVMTEEFLYPDPSTLRYFHSDIDIALKSFEGCAKIKISVPKMKVPPLPFRREDGKIIYPSGILEGVWCFPEIRLALEMGCKILETDWIIIGDRIPSPWGEYVTELYNDRLKCKANNDPMEEVIKIFMNALYGKFAQKSFQDKIMKLEDSEDAGETFYDGKEWFIRLSTEPERADCDILCLASYVTSYARCHIYKYYRKCNFDFAYSDTDSIITSIFLEDSKELGKMKLEHKVKYASFKGRKDYILILEDKAILKRKGVSVKSIQAIKKSNKKLMKISKRVLKKLNKGDIEICKAVHESDFVIYEKILKSRESLRRKLQAGHSYDQQKERLKPEDDGRLWLDTDSIPIHQL